MSDGVTASNAALQVLDLEVLLRTAAGDRTLARELMILFLEMAKPVFTRLAAAMQSGDCAASRRESHALSGAAGLIGANAMVPLLKEIEVFSLKQQSASVAERLRVLTPAFASVMAAVSQALQDFDPPDKVVL